VVDDGRLYVLSAAFLTGQDPNILVAGIDSDAATRGWSHGGRSLRAGVRRRQADASTAVGISS